VSATSVRRLLAAMGYSLQSNRKTREGEQPPDRDGQFRHSTERLRARKKRGEPALSVDTRKKEVLGSLKNAGPTYRPKGDPEQGKTHDFPDPKLGKAIPYGVCDRHGNEAGGKVTRPLRSGRPWGLPRRAAGAVAVCHPSFSPSPPLYVPLKKSGKTELEQERCRTGLVRPPITKGSDRLCRKPSRRPKGARSVCRRCIVADTPARLHCRATILPCNGCNGCNDATILGQTGTDADL
jgi:hypothetical protein